jgi:uncharacterized protein YcgL (UPF0745 family)
MQCFIHKSLKKEFLYLYTVSKEDFSTIPEELLTNLGKLELVMELDLTEDRKLAREDASKVMNSLKTKGYFVLLPPTNKRS